MFRSNWFVVIAMLSAIAILSALGSWQVIRLNWKEELIARTRERISQPPVKLSELEAVWAKSSDIGYMPVQLSGHFVHDKEMYYYNTHAGKAGWNVITPMLMPDKRVALINRGFVPLELHKPETRLKGQVEGEIQLTGLARNPVLEKPNSFIPDNSVSKRELFWKDQKLMSSLAGQEGSQVLPFTIDLKESNKQVPFPKAATTRVNFPNSHLQYAITWFGLAGAALVVGISFLMRRRSQQA